MSEEKPVFKVTDRRLFNPDGTPRDLPQEEEKQQAPAEPETGTASSATPAPSATLAAEEAEAARASSAGPSAAPSSTTAERASARGPQPSEIEHEGAAEEEFYGAEDPASFVNFLMSIASNAASALGMMEHPVTGQTGVDLRLAKHWIDVLGMLEQKTRGNLSQQEQQILESLLADLRMQYVSLTSAPRPSGPRFSGRDILGGK